MMLLLAAALLFQDPVTKDEILRLTKEGVKEEEILRKIGSATFKLSVDDIVGLKKEGVGEKVIARMISGPCEVKATNLAHKAVAVRVIGSTIEVGWGESLARGATLELPASGEYTVVVNGRKTSCTVKTPATLTFRGSNHPEFEVVTLYIEDAHGSDTCLVESVIKR
jgi:hypothetical protein